jgi:NAD dependent epimerase/dehydratase family enzyme
MSAPLDPGSRRLRIVLPGGSGQVGTELARYFQQQGHHVTVLTRSPYTAPWQTVHWDGLHPGPWVETLEGADVCIHLSGRSINCRFTRQNRRELHDSRIGPTRLLHQEIAGLTSPPRLWLNASAVSIYPHAYPAPVHDPQMDESFPIAGEPRRISRWRPMSNRWRFVSALVRAWEAAFFAEDLPRTRRIALRSAMVLSPSPGSVFEVLSRLVRMGLGGRQGSGRQFVSWIHAADYARAVEFLIEREEISGSVNMAAPEPLPNSDFMAALREAWEMPNGLPAPSVAIELGAFLMRTESELVLKSRPIVPARLMQAGFEFEFPSWPEAASDLVRRWRSADLGF